MRVSISRGFLPIHSISNVLLILIIEPVSFLIVVLLENLQLIYF